MSLQAGNGQGVIQSVKFNAIEFEKPRQVLVRTAPKKRQIDTAARDADMKRETPARSQLTGTQIQNTWASPVIDKWDDITRTLQDKLGQLTSMYWRSSDRPIADLSSATSYAFRR